MSERIAKIKAIPILEVARALEIKLLRGNKAMCFSGHDQRTPSLSFSPVKNLWHCFGCTNGGSVIDLVMQSTGQDFNRSVAWLEQTFLAGNQARLIRRTYVRPNAPASSTFRSSFDNLVVDPEVYEWLLENCPLEEDGRRYLEGSRGFHRDIIARFRIGQIANPARLLEKSVRRWNETRLTKCGVAKHRIDSFGNNAPLSLVWWKRSILFPFIENGQVRYLQARTMGNAPSPKYVNLNGVPKPLFNIDVLKGLAPGESVFVCEGIPDALAATQNGMRAVAVLGAKGFRDEWVESFRLARVLLVPDRDTAGNTFADDIWKKFSDKGQVATALRLPSGKDLWEFLHEQTVLTRRGVPK